MKSLLVLTAVDREAAPVRAGLDQTKDVILSGIPLTLGFAGKRRVYILVSGPGVFNTAAKLGAVLPSLQPEWILQAGCGGMYPESGLSMGDIVLAASERDLHTGLESKSAIPSPLPFPLMENGPGIPGYYDADTGLLHGALSLFAKKEGRMLPHGPFITVSTVTASKETAASIGRETGGLVENMEGAAAFHTAALFGIPIFEIRSISNPVGSRKSEDWDLETAFIRAGEAALYLLHTLPRHIWHPKPNL
ncbi:futalosine hydrolase [Desulfobotulus alkaliphilus]|uniref:Futalosine hydrolase n=1 Tax=Desulfobotulus alkaliphilus TaxID=622671 RepID=A0A562RS64_9BACT|nr:futalosine hydrolase [Desulfobotulus alkaliphilus]TWI71200.1 futalosine hydrolase [Desulfobotulus alkaliphilus]